MDREMAKNMKQAGLHIAIICGLLSIGTSSCFAGGTEGATPFNFLFLDTNARPAAMGGAYTAIVRDADSLFYNPAGFADVENKAIFTHNEYFQGASQKYGAVALNNVKGLPQDIGMGFSFNTVSYGDIQRTTLSNPSGAGLSDFNARNWAISLGCGRQVKENLSLGIGLKYLYEKIDTYSASAVAADFGGIYSFKDLPFTVGIVIQNIGTKIKFQSERESLPLNLKLGLGYEFLDLGVLAIDLNKPKDGDSTIHFGAEYIIKEKAAIRLGFNGRNDSSSGITIGGGTLYQQFALDYAYIPFGDLGNAHRFSVSLKF